MAHLQCEPPGRAPAGAFTQPPAGKTASRRRPTGLEIIHPPLNTGMCCADSARALTLERAKADQRGPCGAKALGLRTDLHSRELGNEHTRLGKGLCVVGPGVVGRCVCVCVREATQP